MPVGRQAQESGWGSASWLEILIDMARWELACSILPRKTPWQVAQRVPVHTTLLPMGAKCGEAHHCSLWVQRSSLLFRKSSGAGYWRGAFALNQWVASA